ncbi:MAG TPA: chromosomal replication initiator protein DnaA [Candidatus Saccharimonadia bacterium]|nr:chromosomal replication initiator protein DnaA [Candidatus Saccharimonadia bacterium]
MRDVKGLWQSVLGELEVSITGANFNTWFRQTSLVSNEAGSAVIAVPNVITKQWLEKKFHGSIKEALMRADQSIHTVQYKVGTSAAAAPKAMAPLAASSAKRPVAGRGSEAGGAPRQISMPTSPPPAQSNLNPRYTFESFVVGSSNDFAHAACQAVAKSPGTKYNPLFIYGGVGLGKTHLMQAVGNEILRRDPGKRIEYVTIEGFTNEFITSISKKKNESFVEKYRNVDVLIIDDMQFLAGKEKTQDEFFHTFNALHQANKQIIISSDKPPKQLVMLEDRLISRFEMGITVDIQSPDLETRSAIIQSKATSKGIVLPLEVVDYIARHAQSNIRELEGTLTKVLADVEHNGGEPTLARIQRLLAADVAARPKLRPVSPKTIIDRVAAYFDLGAVDICGAKRDKEIVVPRQITMYLMREELGLSYPKIAAAIGGRDHTTAMHSVTKIERLIEADDNLRSDIAAIRERLNTAAI